MKKMITLALLLVSNAFAASEEPCRTDGCVFRRQSEMEATMAFSSQTSSTVSYVKSLSRIGEGFFRMVDNENTVTYLKVSVGEGETEAKLTACFDSRWKKMVCDSLKP